MGQAAVISTETAKNKAMLPSYYAAPFSGAWAVKCEGRTLVKGFANPRAAYKWIRANTVLENLGKSQCAR